MTKMFSTIILSALAMIPSAFAQTSQPIQAKVPFAFTVQSTNLPAGNYRLTYNPTAGALQIRNLDQNREISFAQAAASANGPGPARLVFTCYDKNCSLAQVWQGLGTGIGLNVRQRKQQRVLSFSMRAVTVTIPAK